MSNTPSRFFRKAWVRCTAILVAIIGIWSFCTIRSSQPQIISSKPQPEAVICIDPGHPTPRAPGTNMQNGTSEMEINWEVANKLASILAEDSRIAVVTTRKVQNLVTSNPDRALIANKAKANLAVHLHCDAGPSRGFTVYYPDREGKAEGRTGPSEEVISASSQAAETVHMAVKDRFEGVLHDRGVRGESHTRVGQMNGALTTSIWSEVPTVTIEMVFLSDKSDAKIIKSDSGQQKMAQALADGIMDYLYTTKALKKLPPKQILGLNDPKPG